jgi:sigma-54 dependent transcriptional regulator
MPSCRLAIGRTADATRILGSLTGSKSTMSPRPGEVLTHPNAQSNVLSVRAKALIFADARSQELLAQIQQVARSDAAALIVGETGTGKELVARAIHLESGRRGEFVAVNCGALSTTLAEAELFGHQAGAFTGANETRAGWFETANGGTLFLDEVGDLPLPLQVKLLRVLQEREVVRVGSRRAVPLDVRLVAATNVDLAAATAAGRFRLDLYYRLNVFTLRVPTLAERPADIPPLAAHFLRTYSERLAVPQPLLAPETEAALLAYPWPGNIRELENVMHTAILTARDGVIRPVDLRFAAPPGQPAAAAIAAQREPYDVIGDEVWRLLQSGAPLLFEQIEELVVRTAYSYSGANQVQAAKRLGLSRNALRTLLKRHRLIT